ncbi:uncharacterized protein LOC117168934 [Belonocnema kinseyi]|uniref:uncharacterized protein LOC117168934 n=1 Tax=Belonocnema kinseyi TaxID=2817044 RepID=UPI00143CDF0E|nr:uncharacterized protein LOC117168934 [Belonocnema kinseyi]
MSSRRRRSDDFTDSLSEYHRLVHERELSEILHSKTPSPKNPTPEKKTMVKVKANETITPDTTIFKQVSSLRDEVNAQKQNLERCPTTPKTSKSFKNTMSTKMPPSPISEVLNKISKALELKQPKEESKSTTETSRIEPNKIWNALTTFNRSLNSDKNGLQSHQKVLSRLSQEFQSSPTKFAEKLVTIIEESMMPSASDQKDCSGISVSRMTTEFRKLCKFIEDESMPEWILSPEAIPEEDEVEEQIENQSIDLVDDESNLADSSRDSLASTPFGNRYLMNYAETPKGIFRLKESPLSSGKKPVNKAIKDSRFNESNHSFEYWESMCNGVYLHQRVTPQGGLRRSISLPDSPVRKLNRIRSTCEQQLASLDDTALDQIRNEKPRFFHDFTEDTFGSFSPKQFKREIVKTSKSKKYFSDQAEDARGTRKVATLRKSPKKQKSILKRESVGYLGNCEDELDKSLIAELAQRRQRCFETAKLMMELDKNDPIISERMDDSGFLAKLGSPNKSLSLPGNNREFLNTINHCMEYEDFLLKKRKSIFQIIQQPKASDADSGIAFEASSKVKSPIGSVALKTPVRNDVKSAEKKSAKFSKEIKSEGRKFTNFSKEIKSEENKGPKSLEEMKSEEKVVKSSPNKIQAKEITTPSVIENQEKKPAKSPRRRFFFTPGKSPKTEEVKRKKEYFPEVESLVNIPSSLIFGKSPRTPEIRKNIYENVRSPVAEYIKGTDAKLVKNIHVKKNDWLLTPQPLGISNEFNRIQITPLKSVQESTGLKFNLSPMGKKIADSSVLGDENIPEKEFKLPKIDYKTPVKVHTIKDNLENEPKSQGSRVKTLLKSSEKKIVIRHEGRIAVASPRNGGEDETDNTLVDTSIHVKTIARKTDYIRARTVR